MKGGRKGEGDGMVGRRCWMRMFKCPYDFYPISKKFYDRVVLGSYDVISELLDLFSKFPPCQSIGTTRYLVLLGSSCSSR